MLPYIEPDDDKSIPSAESVFTCVEICDKFLYPCIISDELMDAEEEEFDLDMEIVEAPLSRSKATPKEKGTMINGVHDLLIRANKNLSSEESTKVKELLIEHNETTFHDPEKPFTRTDTIEHEISTSGRPVRIPLHRTKTKKNRRRQDSQNGKGRNDHKELKLLVFTHHPGEKERWHYSFLCRLS